jgi:amino acid adenylation domain-containing protein
MSKLLPEIPTRAATLLDLLRQQALHQPNQPGYTFLLDGERAEAQLTYGELDRQARVIAAQLQARVAPGARALLLYPPGLAYVAALFGCVYAGVVAVPAYPPDSARLDRTLPRLRALAADARPQLALTTAAVRPLVPMLAAAAPDLAALTWLATDTLSDDAATAWQPPSTSADSLALLQYTSGSTAAPRGVMLTHGNLLHNLALIQQRFAHTTASQGVIWLPPYHDMGLIGGILQPLYAGFPVVLMSPVDFLQRPLRWLQAITRYRATTSGGPNFAYDLCVRKITAEQRAGLDLSSWSLAFNGAEPIRTETLARFAAAFAPCGFRAAAFYPCYGLAEATLLVAGSAQAAPAMRRFAKAALEQQRVVELPADDPAGRALVGCGLPDADQQLVIVDPTTATRCERGQIGEIWLAGPSVAQGYWDAQQTAGTFHARLGGEGMFLRTGDLGFVHAQALFITGRLKDLLIIRGRNHYPQDIELTIERCHAALRPGCGAAFAITRDDEERLVVVQEVERGARALPLDEVFAAMRRALAEQHELAAYALVLVEPGSIPKTSSGKIQRAACRAAFLAQTLAVLGRSLEQRPRRLMHAGARSSAKRKNAAGSPEQQLCRVIARLLRVAPQMIDQGQPLSSIGLDSLTLIELQSAIAEQFAVELPLGELLSSSIAALAQLILARQARDLAAPRPASVSVAAPADEYPLSYGQRALWFLHQLAPMSTAYVIASAARLRDVDVAALQRAFTALAERHPILRATFQARDGEPYQQYHAAAAWYTRTDATEWDAATLRARMAEAVRQPFDLARGPLLRVQLYEDAAGVTVLLVVHHLIADLWSMGVFVHELKLLYAAAMLGVPARLPPQRAQYTDFVRWQLDMLAGAAGDRLWSYWRQQLAGDIAALNLPTDHPQPASLSGRGASQSMRLSPAITNQLKAVCQAHGLTSYMLLLAAFQALLYRYSGQPDILVGSPAAGRRRGAFADVLGYFVNPVVLRTRFTSDWTCAALFAQVRQTVLDALDHQDYPFALLAERLQPARDFGQTPIFQVMFIVQKLPVFEAEALAAFALDIAGVELRLGELQLESLALEPTAAQFDLTMVLAELADGLAATLRYQPDRFDTTTISRMLGHFRQLLAGMLDDPAQHIAAIPLLTEHERQQLLVEWNDTAAPSPGDELLHTCFERQAARSPDAVALVYETNGEGRRTEEELSGFVVRRSSFVAHLTYAELNRRANQLAHTLRARGVGPEALVAISIDRSLEMVVGLLGVLKAGAAYLPLDPTYPRERLAFMLEDSQARVLIVATQDAGRRAQDDWGGADIPIVNLAADWPAIALAAPTNPVDQGPAEQLAYVIYTSGSTGRPKGVMNSHSGVCQHLRWLQHSGRLTAADRVLQKTPISFDVSVGDIFWSLLSGAGLVLARPGGHQDSAYLARTISEQRISVIYFVPSMLQVFLDEPAVAATRLRLVISTGEALSPELQVRFFAHMDAALRNIYGPTEAAIGVTFWDCPTEPAQAAGLIGRPITNTRIYLLDRQMQPVPIGMIGEVFIGGACLARGYLKRPDLTAERFVPCADEGRTTTDDGPDSSLVLRPSSGDRLYRTGDLARYRTDGLIAYLGRIDGQVKLRGFRIELGEIEATLRAHPAVREAIVLARAGLAGDTRLAAYVVITTNDGRTTNDERDPSVVRRPSSVVQELRSFLQQRLPEYMLPAAFVLLDALPLLPNGKLDRRALPAPDPPGGESAHAFVAPRTPVEADIAAIWGALLGGRVSVTDNFFELGGHSLLMMQVLARIRRRFNVELPMQRFFQSPTVAGLAQAIAQQPAPPADEQRITRRAATIAPLSFEQSRLWLLHQLEPASPAYNLPLALRLVGPLDMMALARCVQALRQRHETLRTTFGLADGQPVQIIAEIRADPRRPAQEDAPFAPLRAASRIRVIDVQALPETLREAAALRLATTLAQEPFDLARGPLLRTTVLRLTATAHVLVAVAHHIIADGWSIGVFARELAALYGGSPGAAALPELPIQYADYAIWQRQGLQARLAGQLGYWRGQLADTPTLELPTDRPRPPIQSFQGATFTFQLDEPLTRGLQALSLRNDVTLFMLLLAAFQTLLARYSGQTDIAVGTPIANRAQIETEPLIGCFVNMLVLRGDLARNPTFVELLRRIQTVATAAYANQDVPFDRLVEELRPQRDLGRTPLFQVVFALQNTPAPTLELPGLVAGPLLIENGTAKFDLTLTLTEHSDGLHGALEYAADLFDAPTITRMAGHLRTLLAGIAADPALRCADLPLLTKAELAQIAAWNASAAAYPHDAAVHSLFEAQVDRTPDAVAAVYDTAHLTYAALNTRANQLAHALIARGVGPDTLVAVCAERSLAMLVGIFGILKAGGAYVPLDPTYPAARLAFMLADTQAPVLVLALKDAGRPPADDAAAAAFGARQVVDLHADWPTLAGAPTENPPARVGGQQLAYVIYTSGSTGVPKGAMVLQRGLLNLCYGLRRFFADPAVAAVGLLTSISFDISVNQIFPTLLCGRTLHIIAEDTKFNSAALLRYAQTRQLHLLDAVPSYLHTLLTSLPATHLPNALRYLLVGGEKLDRALLQRLFAQLGEQVVVVNIYGLTESSDINAFAVIPAAIGTPLHNNQLYILNRRGQLQPIGVAGELGIAGASLSRGYLNRPDLTAARFVPNSFLQTTDDRRQR